MPAMRFTLVLALLSLIVGLFPRRLPAETRYVAANGLHVSPFADWEHAATNIATALLISEDGDTVLVSNGVFVLSGEALITNGIRLASVNGANFTTVVAGSGAVTNRCFRLVHPDAIVDGFSLSGGRE